MNTERGTTPSKAGLIILMLVCLGLVAATVFAVKTSYALRFELKQKDAELQELKHASPAGLASTEAATLRERNAELQATLDRLRKELEQQKETVAPVPGLVQVVSAPNAPAAAATNRLSWIERIRQDDPARYKQLMEEREQRRQQRDAAMQEQYARLDERLKTAQTQQEVDLVNQISATLQKMDELRGKWEALQQLPEEERQKQVQELRAESWQTFQSYRQLRAQDRQLQLEHLAAELGYREPKDVSAFVDSVQRINKETDVSGRGMGFGRGGGGPPSQ
jgi:predicted RND superfamily exporter protein